MKKFEELTKLEKFKFGFVVYYTMFIWFIAYMFINPLDNFYLNIICNPLFAGAVYFVLDTVDDKK